MIVKSHALQICNPTLTLASTSCLHILLVIANKNITNLSIRVTWWKANPQFRTETMSLIPFPEELLTDDALSCDEETTDLLLFAVLSKNRRKIFLLHITVQQAVNIFSLVLQLPMPPSLSE